MPSGKHLNQTERNLLLHNFAFAGKAAQEVSAEVFLEDTSCASLQYLEKQRSPILRMSEDEAILCATHGENRRKLFAGRMRKFDENKIDFAVDIIRRCAQVRLTKGV